MHRCLGSVKKLFAVNTPSLSTIFDENIGISSRNYNNAVSAHGLSHALVEFDEGNVAAISPALQLKKEM